MYFPRTEQDGERDSRSSGFAHSVGVDGRVRDDNVGERRNARVRLSEWIDGETTRIPWGGGTTILILRAPGIRQPVLEVMSSRVGKTQVQRISQAPYRSVYDHTMLEMYVTKKAVTKN